MVPSKRTAIVANVRTLSQFSPPFSAATPLSFAAAARAGTMAFPSGDASPLLRSLAARSGAVRSVERWQRVG
jgi:hypothetical protein